MSDIGRVREERKIPDSPSSDRMLDELSDRYVRKPVRLRALSPDEVRLIDALRADPDQSEHLATLVVGGFALQHPILERLERSDLTTCPINLFLSAVFEDWITEVLPDEPGRYRVGGTPPDLTFERLPDAP